MEILFLQNNLAYNKAVFKEEIAMLTNSTEELVVRAESGDVEAIKELASFFRESNEEIDQRKAFMLYQKANEISSGDPKTIAQLFL